MNRQSPHANEPFGRVVPKSHANDLCLSVSPVPSAVGLVRKRLGRHLQKLGRDDLTHTALLVASEIVTNAVREHQEHCPHVPIIIRAFPQPDGRFRIEVDDVSPARPEIRSALPLEESGRGLAIASTLSDEMGYSLRGNGGKTVWTVLS